ncbi:MAG: FAD-dependent oxidoreductase [Gammaproteobacteria bacterium]|nr:FAD-dependent oxidoreductase [Gammaproteobacteria bacterium]MBI5615269.1 FAD-dependent oxidoreductase [Gammaproteobacteria bacterium]
MPLRLLKYGFKRDHAEPRYFNTPAALKDSYDVVIVGAGGHGLACAYNLAHYHGITRIAVVDRGYLGGGNTGRNTTIVRSNYLTPEGVRFYDRSVQIFKGLSAELDFNLFYSERGHFTLAHNEGTLRTARWRAEVNKHYGVESEVVGPDDVKRACPEIDLGCGGRHPIVGALYHAPGAIVRHDAVAWGYARQASAKGVEIFQNTAVTGIETSNGRVTGVVTDRGRIKTGKVVSATAGATPTILKMVDLESPIEIYPLQACVSEPMKPWLDTIIVSGSLHVYVSQTARGELVMGAAVDPAELHSTRSSFEFVTGIADQMLDLFPFLAGVKIVRQWAGMADMTPDFAPVMGKTPVAGFYLDAGWGTWGFKATPVCGETMAYTVANDRNHELITGFGLDRFERFEMLGEKGAAAVGH